MGDDLRDTATRILSGYRIHNAEVLFREDCGVDDLIDVIEGNRKYVRCLYVYNKIDTLSIEEVDLLARLPDAVVISIHTDLNIEYLLQVRPLPL
jgi:ribosome-interacting GTPase 1